MSPKNNEIKFDTELLLNDVNKVIQNGINDILNDYIDNYKLYEETHNYIMNLPCIKRENYRIGLNNNVVCKTDFSGGEHDIDIVLLDKYLSDKDDSSQEETESDTSEDNTLLINAGKLLKQHEKTIETRDKQIDDLKKILQTTQDQNDKRYDMFYQQKDLYEELIKKYVKEIEDLKNQLKDCIKKPVICDLTADEPEKEFVEIKQEKVEEKENITLHIEEESEVEESDDEDVDQEESDEDDVNPLMITCSSIKIQKEENILSNIESEDEEIVDEEEEVVDEEEEIVDEEEEENDTVETENSSSDKESQKEDEEKNETEEDEEQELIEIEIDGVTYCTENEENGFIYLIDEDGNVGEATGYLKDGEPFFN